MKKITTYSGAVYYIDGTKITGGSKKLKNGELLVGPIVGRSMYIYTPERHHLNPHFSTAGVTTSYVVSIEDVYTRREAIKLAISAFVDAWRSR